MTKANRFRVIRAASIAALLIGANPSGHSQLRSISPYSADRINPDGTYFVLRQPPSAAFGWASEWTQGTVQDNADKHAFFVWQFKDGTKAYAHQSDFIGDVGKTVDYLVKSESPNLESAKRDKIQPLTRANYPTRVELWLGEFNEQTGYRTETLIDSACFDSPGIEHNQTYHFSECRASPKP
jgi:hypothetical protein